jgi:hypothetical protein
MSSPPWTLITEIFPIHVIGTAVSLATFSNWMTNFFVATVFPLALQTEVGRICIFILLAFMCLSAWVFVYCLIPETANREIKEIVDEITKKK